MIRILALLTSCVALFTLSCEEEAALDYDCTQGKIVGQKCNVFALQLPERVLGATEWQTEPVGDAAAETFNNVICLIDLPPEFRVEGKILFVSVRKPTNEESTVPCYHDLPGPPHPYYVVVQANEASCHEKENQR